MALRSLVERLGGLRDVQVGILTRPQSGLADFYRELGDLYGVAISPHNRWAGTKVLRDRWRAHVESALYRPVLVADEAQEMLSTGSALPDDVFPARELATEALATAAAFNHPVYDALYAVTARREGAAVCTIDQRLVRLLGEMRVPAADL